MESISKSKIRRLGDRIRKGESNDSDSLLLYEYRRSFTDVHNRVISVLRDELEFGPSARVKSNASIRDKLLRQPTLDLAQMQDIVGCRIVVRDFSELSAAIAKLVERFYNVKIRDRLESPSHGYRAVHLILELEKKHVEIQVRTRLQHAWANLSEKLSDKYGMSLKYGGGPKERREPLLRLSDTIYVFERFEELYQKSLGEKPASEMSGLEVGQMTTIVTLRIQIENLFEAAISAVGEKDED